MRLSSLLVIGAIGLCGCSNSSSHSTEAPQEDALNELRDGLKSENEQARFNAAWAIGNMGPEAQSLVPDLSAVLRNDSSVAVRTMAAQALAHIDPKGEQCIQALGAALADEQTSNVLEKVAESLAKIGPPAAPTVSTLIPLLRHPDPKVRFQVCKALGSMGAASEKALEALGFVAEQDVDDTVAAAASEAVKRILTQ
jgi:HEAT repeat protein